MSESWNEKAVFLAALGLQPGDREAFLLGACPEPDRLVRIQSLLRHSEPLGHSYLVAFDALEPELDGGPEEAAFVDEFRILRVLGQGGMGTVYLARDTVLDRMVALKIVARHLVHSEQALKRFSSEAKIAAKLKHPGIVPVYKFGYDGRDHYLVVQYVEGPTLAQVLADQRQRHEQTSTTQSLRQWHAYTIETLAAVAEALDSAHRVGVVHRDVKPSNILIDGDTGPRLTDFGIAIQVGAEATTRSHEVMGSCYYMSPEQAREARHEVDHRSDIFSLGVILYEMLTHRRPFEGTDANAVLRAVLAKEPARPRALDRKIPRDLEIVCLKCLEKRPADRYQSAAHLAADLRCVLARQPILARPPGLIRRAVRTIRKHRSVVSAAVAILLLAALASLIVERAGRSRAALGTVSFAILGDSQSATLYRRSWDPARCVYGPARRMDTLASSGVRLPPGTYRFVVVDAEGRFADVEDMVLSGSTSHHAMRLAPPDASFEGMVRFDPGKVATGRTLAQFVDPMSTEATDSYPILGPFWLDAAEVTNAQYREFAEATGAPPPFYWQGADPIAIADLPVVCIARDDMLAYALWRGKRLPTMYEWLFAAQMPGGVEQAHPWAPDSAPAEAIPTLAMIESLQETDLQKRLAAYLGFAVPVRSRPALSTPAGLFHMFGNVREMTSSVLLRPGGTTSVLAGAAWGTSPQTATCFALSEYPLTMADLSIGFRCARSEAPALKD